MHDVLHGKRILCGRMLEQSHTWFVLWASRTPYKLWQIAGNLGMRASGIWYKHSLHCFTHRLRQVSKPFENRLRLAGTCDADCDNAPSWGYFAVLLSLTVSFWRFGWVRGQGWLGFHRFGTRSVTREWLIVKSDSLNRYTQLCRSSRESFKSSLRESEFWDHLRSMICWFCLWSQETSAFLHSVHCIHFL